MNREGSGQEGLVAIIQNPPGRKADTALLHQRLLKPNVLNKLLDPGLNATFGNVNRTNGNSQSLGHRPCPSSLNRCLPECLPGSFFEFSLRLLCRPHKKSFLVLLIPKGL